MGRGGVGAFALVPPQIPLQPWPLPAALTPTVRSEREPQGICGEHGRPRRHCPTRTRVHTAAGTHPTTEAHAGRLLFKLAT